MSDRIDLGGAPWTAIPRDLLRDPHLSVKAKGALVTLLSHDDGWVRSVIGILLKENAGLGREGAQSAMRELVEAGYAERHTSHDENGKFRTSYVVRPTRTPQSVSSEEGTSLSPRPVQPSTVQPSTAKPAAVVDPLVVDPLEEEPKSEDLALRADRTPALFEILYLVQIGREYKPGARLTHMERGKINKAEKVIREAGYSSVDVCNAIAGWATAMGDTRITALALAGQMERCLSAAEGQEFRKVEQRPSMTERAADALRELLAEQEVAVRREEVRILTDGIAP